MTKHVDNPNRPFIRNLAAYVAGAWASIEILDFLISRYSLPSVLIDVSVFLCVIGFAIVVVLTWFHGASGRQRFAIPELVALSVLAVIAASGAYVIGNQDPLRDFFEAEGFRFTVEAKGSLQGTDDNFIFHAGLPDGEFFENSDGATFQGGFFLMSPKDFSLDGPGVKIRGQRLPVMFSDAINSDDEFARFVVILNSRPSDIDPLIQEGEKHDLAVIETTNFSAEINRPFVLGDAGDSVVIRLIGDAIGSVQPSE